MPLNKVNQGSNMYQDFVDFTHSHLAGECPHKCQYCYVQDLARRFPAMKERYSGPVRLSSLEFGVDYNKRWRPTPNSEWRTGKTIFIENCSDLFAEGIPSQWIDMILTHCRDYPNNTYIFQTKNPGRVNKFLNKGPYFPPRFMIGTTAESNRHYQSMSISPTPMERMKAMRFLAIPEDKKFLTIEPVLRFNVGQFVAEIIQSYVGTIYIGADSKNHGLPEPTGEEIGELVRALREAGKTVVLKSNLSRLYKGE